jgi:hypothetical protein
MGTVIELTGYELSQVLTALGVPDDSKGVHHVRVAIDGGFKISINHGAWSPPMGKELAH